MKILHVEDNATDALLIADLVRMEWPTSEIDLVETRDAFSAKLGGPSYDLIISDFGLVSFNGLEALNIAQAKQPETPFIFVSGTIGEDRAVESLRAGASDYIIKDRTKRLVPAIKRAMAEADEKRKRREAEEQLLRVQRLENIGMLAAGIAHDVNNVLSPILMGVPLLRDRAKETSDLRILDSMEASARRGADLVRQILGFAHGVTGEPQVVQVKHLLNELGSVMVQTFPKEISIDVEFSGPLWPIKANPTQIHQVLLNLCVNARDAMPNGGTLRLRAENLRTWEPDPSGAPPGAYLVLEVSDTGSGIPPEVIAKIWEPFFTTKEAGRGTGLGLSTVRGIVQEHHGFITLHSRVGHGTAFRILLPALADAQSDGDSTATAHMPRGQGELVLVVDDDPSVRDVTSAILTHYGYRVLAAMDGTEAIALFAPRNLEVRVVVTDISMPNLDGLALAKVVRNLNPSVKVVVVSGLAPQLERARQHHCADALLEKPFSSTALLTSVADLLRTTSAN